MTMKRKSMKIDIMRAEIHPLETSEEFQGNPNAQDQSLMTREETTEEIDQSQDRTEADQDLQEDKVESEMEGRVITKGLMVNSREWEEAEANPEVDLLEKVQALTIDQTGMRAQASKEKQKVIAKVFSEQKKVDQIEDKLIIL
jgi:ABC-type Na+ efflux pump permease subunit